MKQAAEFFKSRWKFRADLENYKKELKAKKINSDTASIIAEGHKKELDDETNEASGKEVSKNTTKPEVSLKTDTNKLDVYKEGQVEPNLIVDEDSGKDKDKKSKDTDKKPEPASKKEVQTKAEQQKIITDYIQSALTVLEHTIKTDPSKKNVVQKSLDLALKLISKKNVTPEELLNLGENLKQIEKTVPEVKSSLEELKSNKWSSQQRNYWETIEAEVKLLQEQERKGEKLKFSKGLINDSLSIFESFLGPFGPLVKTTREFYEEYKDGAKSLKAKYKDISTWGSNKLNRLKKIWSTNNTLSKRLLPKFASILDKFGNSLKNIGGGAEGSSFLEKFKSFGAGKYGKIAAGVAGTAAVIGAGSAVVAGTNELAPLLLGMTASKPKDTADKKAEVTEDTIENAQKLGLLPGIMRSLKTFGKTFNTMFAFGWEWLTSSTNSVGDWLKEETTALASSYESVKNKVSAIMDWSPTSVASIWSGILHVFSKIWESISAYVPDFIKRAWLKAKDAKSATDAENQAVKITKQEETAKAEPKAEPKGRDTTGGDGAASASSKVTSVQPEVVKTGTNSDVELGKKSIKGAKLDNVNPTLVHNFLSMAGEYKRLTNKNIQVNDAFRSNAEQAALRKAYPNKAAKPGYSMHEYGFALDIQSVNANELTSLGLMSKYGFTRPVPGETWHIEPVAIQGLKNSIRKGKDVNLEKAVVSSSDQAKSKTETEGQAVDQTALAKDKVTNVPAANSAATSVSSKVNEPLSSITIAPGMSKSKTEGQAVDQTALAKDKVTNVPAATSVSSKVNEPLSSITSAPGTSKVDKVNVAKRDSDTAFENFKKPVESKAVFDSGINANKNLPAEKSTDLGDNTIKAFSEIAPLANFNTTGSNKSYDPVADNFGKLTDILGKVSDTVKSVEPKATSIIDSVKQATLSDTVLGNSKSVGVKQALDTYGFKAGENTDLRNFKDQINQVSKNPLGSLSKITENVNPLGSITGSVSNAASKVFNFKDTLKSKVDDFVSNFTSGLNHNVLPKRQENEISLDNAALSTSTSKVQQDYAKYNSVSPFTEDNYNRVNSRSKIIEQSIDPAPIESNNLMSGSTSAVQTHNIPLYLGDMSMLTFNLGVGS